MTKKKFSASVFRRYIFCYQEIKVLTHPNMQSPVNGSQSPAHSHGRHPYSWKPQYPTMHLSQWAPPTPGLQMQFPFAGSQSEPSAKWKGIEPMGWQLHAGEEKGEIKLDWKVFNGRWYQNIILALSERRGTYWTCCQFITEFIVINSYVRGILLIWKIQKLIFPHNHN